MTAQRFPGWISEWVLLGFLLSVFVYGMWKRAPIYHCFVEGAQEGFTQAVQLIPYFAAIMFPITLLRESGAIGALGRLLAPALDFAGFPAEVIPLMIVRPLSGGASLGVLMDILETSGPDSWPGWLAGVYQGGTDTTFFVISMYFGSVGVKDHRYALKTGLLADLTVYAAGFVWVSLFMKL
ncbi:MAG: spore maturation protein [Peptococcaceae bacterium]|jgi:spore maturation protein B|nr:spore maturation protein [Peptococcaceae bacterium]